MELILLPFVSVGEFRFLSNISEYSSIYDFSFESFVEGELPEWDTYELKKIGLEIYVEEDKIVSICCRKSLLYNGFQILGNHIQSLCLELGISPDETDSIYLNEEDIPHDIYEFDSLGIQIWVKDNIIDAVFCSGNESDE